MKDFRDELPEAFVYWNDLASKGGILDYYEFNTARTEILDAFVDVFEHYDILLSPPTCCLPPLNAEDGNTQGPDRINGQPVEPLIGFAQTFLANFSGHPAASIPAGFSESGLPIGLQIIGKKFKDEDIFAAAKTFEDLRPWRLSEDL